jgi:Domain of unknown function (DUF1824)
MLYHQLFRSNRCVQVALLSILLLALFCENEAFATRSLSRRPTTLSTSRVEASVDDTIPTVNNVEDATRLLSEWDKLYNPETPGDPNPSQDTTKFRETIPKAVLLLSRTADEERSRDSTQGRCMLGICASSPEEGIATLKSWVTGLQLPRGLLHGFDKDGVPLELNGGVYIKYNSGGVYSFEDIRKSGMGFDALWKPGDALLEPYDGEYRGVYFQVELSDKVFRQYLVPLDLFER